MIVLSRKLQTDCNVSKYSSQVGKARAPIRRRGTALDENIVPHDICNIANLPARLRTSPALLLLRDKPPALKYRVLPRRA
jgi:hypothetical protein